MKILVVLETVGAEQDLLRSSALRRSSIQSTQHIGHGEREC